MNTPSHWLVGVSAAALTAHAMHYTPLQGALMAAAAVVTSGAGFSPDVDNQKVWQLLDRILPDEWLGHGGPLQHRGLMHWWGLPAAAFIVWAYLGGPASGPGWTAAFGAWVGWVSHLAADFVVGHEGYGHGRGIPWAPWWGHFGLGIHNSGATAHLVVVAVLAGTGWVLLGMPDLTHYLHGSTT